jgi:hypothetical protein
MKKSRNVKRWDAIEDATIIEFIKKYPTNLNLAFKQAAVKLGRSESSCSQHYYAKLRNADPIIVVGSDQGLVSNKKVVKFEEDASSKTRKAMMLAMFASLDPAIVVETFLGLLTMDEQKDLFKRATVKLAS